VCKELPAERELPATLLTSGEKVLTGDEEGKGKNPKRRTVSGNKVKEAENLRKSVDVGG